MQLVKIKGHGYLGFHAFTLFYLGNCLAPPIPINATPVMDISNMYSSYHMDFKDNMWLYYFDQPEIIEENVIEVRDNFFGPSAFINKKERINYSKALTDYIKIKPHILEKAHNFKNQYFNNNKILGVHVRETAEDRPLLSFDYYKHKIDLYFEKEKYDKVFICCESQLMLDRFKNTYQDKLIFYPSFKFSNRGHGEFNTAFNQESYIRGEDVLIESLLLSQTNFLLKTASNVSNFSIIYSPNLEYCNIDYYFYKNNKYSFKIEDITFFYECKYENENDLQYFLNQQS